MRDVDLRGGDGLEATAQLGAAVAGEGEAAGHRAGDVGVVEGEVQRQGGEAPGLTADVQVAGVDLRRAGDAHVRRLEAVGVAVRDAEVPLDVPPARAPGVIALAAHGDRPRLVGDGVGAAGANRLLEAADRIALGAVAGDVLR